MDDKTKIKILHTMAATYMIFNAISVAQTICMIKVLAANDVNSTNNNELSPTIWALFVIWTILSAHTGKRFFTIKNEIKKLTDKNNQNQK